LRGNDEWRSLRELADATNQASAPAGRARDDAYGPPGDNRDIKRTVYTRRGGKARGEVREQGIGYRGQERQVSGAGGGRDGRLEIQDCRKAGVRRGELLQVGLLQSRHLQEVLQ
jgi:hypothetical protein